MTSRTLLVLLAACVPVAAQDGGEDAARREEARRRTTAAADSVREKLRDLPGVRAVSYGGVDPDWRILVSVDDDDARQVARDIAGWDTEGIKIMIYAPSLTRRVYRKPEPAAGADPAPTPSQPAAKPVPPPADPADRKPRKPTASEDLEAKIRALEGKQYTVLLETIAVVELMECDAVRCHYGLPDVKRTRDEGRCQVSKRLVFGGGRLGGETRYRTTHRDDCPFGSEDLIANLPDEARTDLVELSRLVRKARR